jgi:hypothetical protein
MKTVLLWEFLILLFVKTAANEVYRQQAAKHFVLLNGEQCLVFAGCSFS